MNTKFKSGFCAIIGMPNVGKSTLLNAIAGQKIAIISDKPQTTRNRILAIYSTPEEQIIFTDTPGIHDPHNKLGEYMVKIANDSMRDTDVVVFVVDASKGIRPFVPSTGVKPLYSPVRPDKSMYWRIRLMVINWLNRA